MTDGGSLLPPSGWHDDPDNPTSLRYWDGTQWTKYKSPKQLPATKSLPPAGWHDDPDNPTSLRYWDGTQWTEHRTPKHPPAASPAAEQELPLRGLISSAMKLPANNVADTVADVAKDVADKAGGAASGAADVAGDVADKVVGAAAWVVHLLRRIAFVVLFPLWLVLLLFGCGPLS